MSRLVWLKAIVIVAFGISLVLSAPLWIGPRTYPCAPVWNELPPLGHPLDQLLYAVLFVCGIAILIAARPRIFIAALVAIVVLFCAFDQTRWQPWVFLYVFLLAALGLSSWRDDDDEGSKRTLNIARLMIAGTYFFAGVQKINWNFITFDFPDLIRPITDAVPALATPLYYAGMAAPFVEAAFAIGLLTRRWRRLSLVLAIGMHVLILAMLGPFGQNWNMVVWPWTAGMAIFDLLLFGGGETFSWREIFPAKPLSFHAVALLLFGILPFLSFANLWDSNLSAAIYSGNLTEATVYVSDAGRAALPAQIQRHFLHAAANTYVANIQRWTIEELKVPPFPETRVYKAIARQLCQSEPDTRQLVLMVREQRVLFSTPETGYRCDQL